MLQNESSLFGYYPNCNELDLWVESIMNSANECQFSVISLPDNGITPGRGLYHLKECEYFEFSIKGMSPFYAYFQPTWSTPSPLLVHVPGYGAEISMHPEFSANGYNVLHISPLGYNTPNGFDISKMENGNWPVLTETILSGAEKGYKQWLMNCVVAIKWVMNLPSVIENRVSFFGTSQGGGGAILLGSLFKDIGVRCVAADVPFLTNFPLANGEGAYYLAKEGIKMSGNESMAWRALGYIDTLSHVHRLTIPVLLTQGSEDNICPPETIETLYKVLPNTKSITYINGVGHRYTTEFIAMSLGWFRLYA